MQEVVQTMQEVVQTMQEVVQTYLHPDEEETHVWWFRCPTRVRHDR